MAKLFEIEGIGDTYASCLKETGITTIRIFLRSAVKNNRGMKRRRKPPSVKIYCWSG